MIMRAHMRRCAIMHTKTVVYILTSTSTTCLHWAQRKGDEMIDEKYRIKSNAHSECDPTPLKARLIASGEPRVAKLFLIIHALTA
jgi:hypothetical protein